MVKFNYINWVTENKHNLLSEQCRQKSQELVDSYSAEELQSRLDQIMMDMEQEAEPEGGPIADMYADEIQVYEDAIKMAKGSSDTPLTYDQAIGRSKVAADRDAFERSSKFDRDKWEDDFDKKFPSLKEATEKFNVFVDGEKTEVEIMSKGLEDVQISWGGETHNVEFEYEDVIDDHGNEGKDLLFTAESEDGKWEFGLDVYASNYDMTNDVDEWDWNDLEINKNKDWAKKVDDFNKGEVSEAKYCESCGQTHEGSCGYTPDGSPRNKPAGPDLFKDPKNLMEMALKLGYLDEQDDEDLRLEPEDEGDVDEIFLDDLDFETLKSFFPNSYQKEKFTRPQTDEPYYEDAISFPNLDDSMMVIGDSSAL